MQFRNSASFQGTDGLEIRTDDLVHVDLYQDLAEALGVQQCDRYQVSGFTPTFVKLTTLPDEGKGKEIHVTWDKVSRLELGHFEGEDFVPGRKPEGDVLEGTVEEMTLPQVLAFVFGALPDAEEGTGDFENDRAAAKASDASQGGEDPTEPLPEVDNSNAVAAQLTGWWVSLAYEEVGALTEKMFEYGGHNRASDLVEIGRTLVQSGVEPGPFLDSGAHQEGHLAELGCYFYLVGKLARWTAAVKEGRLVSDDTLHDIGVYVRMVQRIRAVGGWPV